MLRNVTNIIMTCLLLISTTGFAVSKHYCGADLISVDLKTDAESCCDDGMCCDTETRFLQMDNDFLAVAPQKNLEPSHAFTIIMAKSEVVIATPETGPINSFNYTAPPPRCIGTRLALQQVYRL